MALAGWRTDRKQQILDAYVPRRGEGALGGVKRWEERATVALLPTAKTDARFPNDALQNSAPVVQRRTRKGR